MGDGRGARLTLRLLEGIPGSDSLREWRDDLHRALKKALQGSDENSPGHPGGCR